MCNHRKGLVGIGLLQVGLATVTKRPTGGRHTSPNTRHRPPSHPSTMTLTQATALIHHPGGVIGGSATASEVVSLLGALSPSRNPRHSVYRDLVEPTHVDTARTLLSR